MQAAAERDEEAKRAHLATLEANGRRGADQAALALRTGGQGMLHVDRQDQQAFNQAGNQRTCHDRRERPHQIANLSANK